MIKQMVGVGVFCPARPLCRLIFRLLVKKYVLGLRNVYEINRSIRRGNMGNGSRKNAVKQRICRDGMVRH